MITKNTLEEAINEAKRFIQAATTAQMHYSYHGNKHTAAARRSSLDLTRSLSKLRARPSYDY